MSTQIKKNGNWVTVAGGTRMWVGTKAALQAALDAGELVDGTAVMVTDDYDEGVEKCGFAELTAAISPAASKSAIVTFNTPMPNTNYVVTLGRALDGTFWADQALQIINKTVNGFAILVYNTAGQTYTPTAGSGIYWRAEPSKNS